MTQMGLINADGNKKQIRVYPFHLRYLCSIPFGLFLVRLLYDYHLINYKRPACKIHAYSKTTAQ